MENVHNKLKELGNYLLSVCDKSDEEYFYNIKGTLIDLPEFLCKQVLNVLRPEDENENVDNKKSQLNEWALIYGLDLSNKEVKNKVLEHLNILLKIKNSL
jgi:hypothetical protein